MAPQPDRTYNLTYTDQPVEPTVRELIGTAAQDVTTMLSAQVELAKAELRESAKQAGSAFGLVAVALVVALLGIVFLLVTVAYVLVGLGLPPWAGFGIVTLLLFVLAAILAAVGKRHADRIRGPELTMGQLEATRQAFSRDAGDGAAASPAAASATRRTTTG